MNWILDHLQIIIGAAGAIAWWLNQRRQAKSGEEEMLKPETTFEDPDLAERTRRIREDIQRKIEQRTRGYDQPEQTAQTRSAPVAPPPIIREVARRQVEPPPLSRAASAHIEAQRTAEILEQQVTLQERLRQAQEMKAAAQRRVQFENQVSSGNQAAAVSRGALVDDLSNPAALRRAFIMREIIGPPVALR